jgi:hypothetical protein
MIIVPALACEETMKDGFLSELALSAGDSSRCEIALM